MKIPAWLLPLALLLPSAVFAATVVFVSPASASPTLSAALILALSALASLLTLPALSHRSLRLGYLSVALLIVPVLATAYSNVGCTFCGTKEQAAKLFVTEAIQIPLTAYRLHVGHYPTTREGLAALVRCPNNLEARWRGPYIAHERTLLDPWGRPYQYRSPGIHHPDSFDIWSLGPDGQTNTDDDIHNWP